MQKFSVVSGAILGALSVMIGAFGAHGLHDMLVKNGHLETFETGVKYQFYHSLALVLVGILAYHLPGKWLGYAAQSFFYGTLIFSGSLYILCLTNVRWLGAITPIGGLLMIAGWVLLGIAAVKGL